jgi:hypothetical protein
MDTVYARSEQMKYTGKQGKWRLFGLGSIIFLLVLLVGCGAGTSAPAPTSSGSSADSPAYRNEGKNTSAQGEAQTNAKTDAKISNQSASTQQKSIPKAAGPQYLIKNLRVTMEFKDTRQTAKALQLWMSTADPGVSSAGIEYQQTARDYYTITMTFSVPASAYGKVQQYLVDYAPQHSGRLLGMSETVQDVTNSYVDTQSRLKNLRTEQERLQVLMGRAQTLSEIITIEQRLTEVEGQIESTQAQLNTLTSQVTFYPVTIVLQPLYDTASPLPPTTPAWNLGQVFRDAFSASLGFGQGLMSFLVWLLAFSVYIIPVVLIAWLLVRRQRRTLPPKSFVSPAPVAPNPSAPVDHNMATTPHTFTPSSGSLPVQDNWKETVSRSSTPAPKE